MSDSGSNKENNKVLKLKGSDNFFIWFRLIKVKLAGKGLRGISTYVDNLQVNINDFAQQVRVDPKPVIPLPIQRLAGAEDGAVQNEVQVNERAAEILKKEKEAAAWDKKYYKALSIILSSIHPNIQGEFKAIDDPAQLLATTKILYGKEEILSEVDLREQLSNLKFDFHTSGDEFFAKIQRLLNRLSDMGVPLTTRAKISTLLQIFKNKEFTTFRDALIPQIKGDTKYDDIVTQFKTFIRRKQDEMDIDTSYYGQGKDSGNGRYRSRGRGRGSTRGRGSSSSARGGQFSSYNKDNKQCYTCNKFGHYSSECKSKPNQIAKLENKLKKLKEEQDGEGGTGTSDGAKKEKEKDEGKTGAKRGNDGGGEEEKAKKARLKC